MTDKEIWKQWCNHQHTTRLIKVAHRSHFSFSKNYFQKETIMWYTFQEETNYG